MSDGIESVDLREWRDGSALRAVAAARAAADEAEQRIVAAVRAARAVGDPWKMIAVMLRTSTADARQRYAELVGEPRSGSAKPD